MSDKKNEDWPLDGLEDNPSCSACGSTRRKILYTDLADTIFSCAPGKWVLYTCLDCGSAYLDPRPDEETIGLAYQTYFTHEDNTKGAAPLTKQSFMHEFQSVYLTNGYRNWRFGTRYKPSSLLGILVAMLRPEVKNRIDFEMRHLPKRGEGKKLLDFGCGNGSFLVLARDAGWDVRGIDFDRKALAVAKQKNLKVYEGGIDVLPNLQEFYDVITLSHVIEHVHDPEKLIKACFTKLQAGGKLWIQTPNIKAQGHEIYGECWRGLEPPRHLTIFTTQSLQKLLLACGFRKVEIIKADMPPENLVMMFSESERIQKSGSVNTDCSLPELHDKKSLKTFKRRSHKQPDCREFITLVAYK